jgi:hypothetical protein
VRAACLAALRVQTDCCVLLLVTAFALRHPQQHAPATARSSNLLPPPPAPLPLRTAACRASLHSLPASPLPNRSPTPGSARVSARQLAIIEDGPPVVVDEIYEHERYQPIKGWGHQWPGHFLPSDRVSHWGDRSGRPGGMMGMEFDSVAPRLPEGWMWRGEWRVQVRTAAGCSCAAAGCWQ